MRADLYLTQYGHAPSRTLARKLIEDGAVTVDGRVLKKASEEIPEGEHTVSVAATDDTRFVGRGGLKLEAALREFRINPEGLILADIGASTGGFTDCLLKQGAALVFAVDAGHGQLHPTLRENFRVRSAEGMNARSLTSADLLEVDAAWRGEHPYAPNTPFSGLVDGIVMDVSFISQTYIHPVFRGLLREGGCAVTLIKPQFEVGREHLGKHGIVREPKWRRAAVERVFEGARAAGLVPVRFIRSPIEGGDGNVEYLALFRLTGEAADEGLDVSSLPTKLFEHTK